MMETRLEAVCKELLAGALGEYGELNWYSRAKAELGDEWELYAKAAKKLEEDGLVERRATFGSFDLLLTSLGKDYCDENDIY